MKAVILAGGLGTRISEESHVRPKPLIEIGGKPILWHIMKTFSAHGVQDFVICCGYKGYLIKEYFANYFLHMADVTLDMRDNRIHVHRPRAEPWRVTLVDTGLDTMTGGRVLRVREYLDGEQYVTANRGQKHYFGASSLSLSPGKFSTDGMFMMSFRAAFQAFWTIHESERSWRVSASAPISFNIPPGKYRLCFRLSLTVMANSVRDPLRKRN